MDLLAPARLSVVGASVPGIAHLRAGMPCQDAFAWRSDGDLVVVAVADGLGSAPRSDAGARAAVDAAAGAATEDVAVAVEQARAALDELATSTGCELRELACTLAVAVLHNGIARAAHVGDGAVIARAHGELVLLSSPGDSEYVDEVDPLTAKDWRARLRISDPVEQVDALALMTDGVQRAALRPDRTPGDGFLAPLFAWAAEQTEPARAAGALAGLLGGRKLSEHSDDDKTLVLAVERS